MERGVTIVPMASGRSLSAEENARVVAAVRELLRAPGVTQVSLAPKLGLKQPTLSAMLGGRHQAGYATARRVAALTSQTVAALLGSPPMPGEPTFVEDAGRRPKFKFLPGWDAAIALARKIRAFWRVPDWAWLELGELEGGAPPFVEPHTLGQLALAWASAREEMMANAGAESEADRELRERTERQNAADLATIQAGGKIDEFEQPPPLPPPGEKPKSKKKPDAK